jgi:hypothetical protein
MRRVIVDYQKLNDDILDLLVEHFPDGYGDMDIISFRNAKNEVVEAIEIKTDDTVYLVKVGYRLVKAMEDHVEEEALSTSESDLSFENLDEGDTPDLQ